MDGVDEGSVAKPGVILGECTYFRRSCGALSLSADSSQSVVLGFVGTLVAIYLPVINDKVFLHAPISWEVRGL